MNYNVHRGTTPGGPYGVVTTLGLVTSYVDSNIQNGQAYYYVTTVVDDTGAESGYSNEASAVRAWPRFPVGNGQPVPEGNWGRTVPTRSPSARLW